MLNSSQTSGGSGGTGSGSSASAGELRAFVAARVGGHSWVIDLVPHCDLILGSDAGADIRIDVTDVAKKHATLAWNGEHVVLSRSDTAQAVPVELNGQPIEGAAQVTPGDEIRIGPATLQVNITLAPTRKGRRSLTHQEFVERVGEELARAHRNGRATCLMMLKSRSGDGSKLATAALSTFREGDIVGTYAHDEIEFLLPDTPPRVATAVVERLLETSGSERASVGLAVAPVDGDNIERLLRSARDALAKALQQGGGIARSGALEFEAVTPDVHTQATRHVIEQIERVSKEDAPLLLVGEVNSGKRYYARLFHEKSRRHTGPYVMIQCAGLVDSDSVAKAFGTNSADVAQCTAESARGGTLMLEEVGDLPLQGQRRLLKLFEEGSEDYNVIATTHRDLLAMCQVGVFLRQLYDKLSRRRIDVPALRMRAESIVPLAQNFARAFQADKPVKLSPGAIDKMRTYSWPGNVLELRNAMERAVTLADGGEILAEHLPGDLVADGAEGRLRDHVGTVERDAIVKALADNNYNQTHAARTLGISRRALIYKMEKYGLKQPPAGKKPGDEP